MVINEFIYIPNETWKNWKYSKIYLEKTDKFECDTLKQYHVST